ncbi:MAG: lysoplasmalogenase [Deltaproteobacteria bacterium]|nr:lysoplasmalogenase [Deltaproteobacteria bacterium]MBN2846302.1 lysoplasmalogenase [Deltaproteobacteria bacterium]
MVNSIIIILAVVLLAGLLYFEKTGNRKAVIPTKTILSLFFVITVIVQSHPVPLYYHLLLAGLILCLIGDFFLALPQKAMFLAGLISFLLGHVLYVLAFFSVASMSGLIWPGVAVVLLISGSVFLWLRPHLGGMKVPVFFYVVIISLMVIGAWSLIIDGGLPIESRIVIFAGALLFYVSDIFVARDRFLKKEFLNRLIGLPLYYAGQFLLAFSVGLIG